MLQQRLGLYLTEERLLPEERENFDLDSLERHLIGRKLLEEKLSGVDTQELLPLLRAQGRLPVGSPGRVLFRQMDADVAIYAEKIKPYLAGGVPAPLDIDLELNGFRLTGRLEGVSPSIGLISSHFAPLQAKYLLAAWIRHLAYGLSCPESRPGESLLICRDVAWKFSPVPRGADLAAELLALYWEGLSGPLHFFPAASFVYARQLLQKEKDHPSALADACREWAGNDFFRGESRDPYLDLLFCRTNPLDDRFHTAAVKVFTLIFQFGGEIANLGAQFFLTISLMRLQSA